MVVLKSNFPVSRRDARLVHEYLKCVVCPVFTNYVCVWFKFKGHVKDPLQQEALINRYEDYF